MADTNFGKLSSENKTIWIRDVWKIARDKMFVSKFMGTDDNSMIQRITELTKTEKGERALMFLIADLVLDGVIGDNEREGNEEAMQEFEESITIDLISHGVISKGKLSEQKHVIKFREQGRDKLAYWLANRLDQLAFLTLSGISYAYKNNGAARIGSPFPNLAFAADISAPTTNRHRNWTGSALTTGDTSAITTAFLPKYQMIIDLVAYAKENYLAPLRAGGKEYYVLLVRPGTLSRLKNDTDFKNAIINAMPRGVNNPFFTGASVTIDGVVIHEHNLVYSTKGATSGSKWGSSGTVDGTRSLLCGSQALGFADLGTADWVEKKFQYNSKSGINVDKMLGFVKPKFYSPNHDSVEDFGVIAVDHAV